jgi:hypothetical protein
LVPAAEGTPDPSVVLLAAALATAAALGFLFGHSTNPNSISTERVVKLAARTCARRPLATLELGKNDGHGNWPMVLRVRGLQSCLQAATTTCI